MYLDKQPYGQGLITQQTVRQFFPSTIETPSFETESGFQHQATIYEPGVAALSQNHFMSQMETALPTGLGDDFWIPDKSTKTCYNCERKFNFVNRRHHCRICGHIFCQKCSFKREVEPIGMMKSKKKQSNKKEVIRVCEYCSGTLDDYISRVKDSAILIKSNIPVEEDRSKMGSLSELENPSTIYTPSTVRRVLESVKEEDETFPSRDKKMESIIPEEPDHGSTENDPVFSYEIEDFLSEGKQKGSPLDKLLNTSNYLHQYQARRLYDYAELHIKEAVSEISKQHGISKQWLNLLFQMTIKAVQNVKTSFRLLNDSMDFHKFVRIKRFLWHDRSKSQYLNGIMATKNVADRRMHSNIVCPRILLISSPLQFYGRPDDRKNYAALNSLIHQEAYYLDILLRKIRLLQPNVIMTQSGASRSVLDSLRQQGITVITNVKKSVMNFVARCTQTIVLPSIDLIDKSVVLGTCSQFCIVKTSRTDRLFESEIENNKQGKPRKGSVEMSQNIVIMDRSKMVFEGCNPILGCTLVLSGPDMEELKKVKQVLRKSLIIARNLVLERGYLLQCGLEYPNYMISEEEEDQEDTKEREEQRRLDLNPDYSPYLGKHFNLLSNSKILISGFKMALGAAGRQSMLNQEVQEIQDRQTSFSSNSSKRSAKVMPLNFARQPTITGQVPELSEAKIKQYIDKICGKQIMERLYFYEGKDQQLGAFICDKLASAHLRCEGCKRPNYMHYYCFYMVDGRIKISLSVNKDRQGDLAFSLLKRASVQRFGKLDKKQHFLPGSGVGKGKNISKEGRITSTAIKMGQAAHEAQFREPVITYCYCKICRKRVTPRQLMNNEFYEYSLSFFMLQYFLNDKVVTRDRSDSCELRPGVVPCGHTGHRAIIRVFRQGSVSCKIDYQTKDRFRFQPLYTLPSLKKLFRERALSQSGTSFKSRDSDVQELNYLIDFAFSLFEKYTKELKQKVQWEVEDVLKRTAHNKKFLRLTAAQKGECLYIQDDQIDVLQRLVGAIKELEKVCVSQKQRLIALRDVILKEGHCLTIQLESARYHMYKLMCKFRVVVKHILRSYINILEYAIIAKRHLNRKQVQRERQKTLDVKHIVPFSEEDQNFSLPTETHDKILELPQTIDQETGIDEEDVEERKKEEAKGSEDDDINFERTKTFIERSTKTKVIIKSRKLENLWPSEQALEDKLHLLDKLSGESLEPFKSQFMRLKPGFNGTFLPVCERNWGSYVGFILISNLYREVLASENYFNLRSELQNFPSFSGGTYKGNVVIETKPDSPDRFTMYKRRSNLNARKSAFPRMESAGIYRGHDDEQEEHHFMEGGGKQSLPTWHLLKEKPNKKALDATRLEHKVLMSSLDVFNAEKVSESLIEDQLLRESKVHLTFRFSGDGQLMKVKVNRNGVVVQRELKSSVDIVSNTMIRFSDFFHQESFPHVYSKITELNFSIFRWDYRQIQEPEKPKLESSQTKIVLSRLNIEDLEREHRNTFKRASSLTVMTSTQSKRSTLQDADLEIPMQIQEMSEIQEEQLKDTIGTICQKYKFQDSNDRRSRSINPYEMERKSSPVEDKKKIRISNPSTTDDGMSSFAKLAGSVPELKLPSNGMFTQSSQNFPASYRATEAINNNDQQDRFETEQDLSPSRRRHGLSGMQIGLSFMEVPQEEKEARVTELTVYFANKFEALRRYYIGPIDEFVSSVAKSSNWSENSGGKSGSAFFITSDQKYIFKTIPKQEMHMFLNMGVAYFRHMGKHFFHGMPSLMAKTLGVFKLVVRESANNKKVLNKVYFLIQENIFYRTKKEKVIAYDLKGSEKRRYVKRGFNPEDKMTQSIAFNSSVVLGKEEEQQPRCDESVITRVDEKSKKVLLDTNFQEDFNGEPIAVSSSTKIYIEAAINNDSLMLSMANVMDYSLLLVLDPDTSTMRAGIIDYMRQYTFDKMLEHSVKYVVNAGLQPTITNPEMYKKRFQVAMDNYFVGMFAQKKEEIKGKEETIPRIEVLKPEEN